MATATTKIGLKVFTTIIDKTFKTGKKVTEGFKETMEIFFNDFKPSVELNCQTTARVRIAGYLIHIPKERFNRIQIPLVNS